MINFRRIRWRNRIISVLPVLARLSELRHIYLESKRWRNEGWTTPPPFFIRRAAILEQANRTGADILVETGTFLGDTTWQMKDRFRKVHTIEIQPQLAELARSRFREFPSVVAHEGDSALVLGEICRTVDSSCLFFLDGHYSGGNTGMGKQECPIIDELKEIFDHTASPFSIIIDDARLFGTHPSYPEVLTLRKFIEERAPHMTLRIENDAIVIE